MTRSDLHLLPGGFQRSRDVEVYPISRQLRRDERTEPADVPADAQRVTQIAYESETVGATGRVPLPGGLAPEKHEEMEEEEGGYKQETHHACVSDEGEGKGTSWDLA